jgi:polyhydroxyalkanoate synthesis regulator phasin
MSIDVYFVINGGAKYWVVAGPSGLMVYVKEGSKSKYLGRKSVAEIKEMLAKADAETLQRIKSDIEAVKQVVESQKPAQTAQTPQTAQMPSLTWKKDGHVYWLVLYAKTVYIYRKGPETRHRPKLVEKTDISGAINRAAAAGALHVLEALRLIINGLHAAVSDLLKPQAERTSDGAQRARRETSPRGASRREAEAALKELKRWLRKEVEAWREKYSRRMEREGLYEADPGWVREDLAKFLREYRHLVEKILPHQDLLDKLADAVAEATAGHLTRSDALEILK